MMKLNRRGFMSLLAAAPVAAGNVTKTFAAKFTGDGAALATNMIESGDIVSAAPPDDQRRKLRTLLKHGIPAWKREQIREYSSNIGSFDTNLLALRSVSPVSKVWIQRERNIKAQECNVLSETFGQGWQAKRDEWLAKTGLGWW